MKVTQFSFLTQVFKGAVLGLWASFLLPISGFIVLCTALVLCDAYTKWQVLQKAKDKVSLGMYQKVKKLVMYYMCIMLSHGIEIVFKFGDWSLLSFVVSGFVCLTEFKSVIENVSDYTGNDLWAALIKKIPSISTMVVDKKEEKKIDEH